MLLTRLFQVDTAIKEIRELKALVAKQGEIAPYHALYCPNMAWIQGSRTKPCEQDSICVFANEYQCKII